MKGVHLKNSAKEALRAVLIAAWIVGLAHQFELWSTTILYLAISLVMVALTFADRLVFKFASRRNRRQ